MWNLKAFVVLIGTLWISGAAGSFTIPDETETEILSQALVRIAKEIIAPINQTINIVTCNGAGNGKVSFPSTLLLINDGDYLNLKVATYISKSSCGKAHLRTINRFSKRTRQWLKPSFDLVKLRSNNHGCPFEIFPFAVAPEIIWPVNIKKGTELYSDFRDISRP